jgi:hypothetical protein
MTLSSLYSSQQDGFRGVKVYEMYSNRVLVVWCYADNVAVFALKR